MDENVKNIVLVGAGRMGGSMLRGWLEALDSDFSFWVVDPHAGSSLDELLVSTDSNPSVVHVKETAHLPSEMTADAIVMATKPNLVVGALEGLNKHIGENTVVSSVAAGVSLETLKSATDGSVASVRAMPNIGATAGCAVTAAVACKECSDDQRALINMLFQAIGSFTWLQNEEHMHVVTAISGSGPAYFFAMCEAMINTAQAHGLDEEAAKLLVIGTLRGSGQLLERNPDPAHLRETVTSPNGTTAAGLTALRDEGRLQTLMDDTVSAAKARSKELESSVC
ncbi:pyrroline-5-carboxylate reductase [Ruegeria atlantica]|uniref:pyrroline-5-carboxylate reductase n=1 Tax=Ruegeria atlantica TaxID=81569 RepID=UPI00147F6FBB|nr:pyrroline-5-carboxylate reductase [Ruegeria atlantica]